MKVQQNLVQFPNLPEHLKPQAIIKAKDASYTEKEAQKLWFNLQGDKLGNGCVDKNFNWRAGIIVSPK